MKASSTSVVLLAVTFVAIVLPTTDAIKCYECSSITSSNCNGVLTDCGRSSGTCYKGSANNMVEKGCAGSGSGSTTGCLSQTYEGKSGTACYCNTDACNVATVSTTPSRVLYVMIPLTVITKLISNDIL
jgi:hypothetical protein